MSRRLSEKEAPSEFQKSFFDFKQSFENAFTTPHPKTDELGITCPEEVPEADITLVYQFDGRVLVYTVYADPLNTYGDLNDGDMLIEIPAKEYVDQLLASMTPDVTPTWTQLQYVELVKMLADLDYTFMMINQETGSVPDLLLIHETRALGGFIIMERTTEELINGLPETEELGNISVPPSTTIH